MAIRLASAGWPGVALGLTAALAAAQPLAAQDGARPVVQPLPPPEAAQLSEALRKIAANPRDLDALLTAGNASLKLDDVDAALGFFARAEEISPGNARIKAGLAAAMVKEENPFDALRLFEEAERGGASLADLAGERALAYDLVGDNARAQPLYRQVLARGEDPEVARRLAISLAISGDQAGMETVLLPMLQRRDLAAYRTRAFALAILGKVDEALAISDTVMPKSMAAKMAQYLREMPKLTRAQKAAAANLGNFPRTADIGRDDPRIALYAGEVGEVAPVRTADARLVPSGEPLGPSSSESRRRQERSSKPQKVAAEGGRAVVTYTSGAPEPEPAPAPVQVAAAAPEPVPTPASAPTSELAPVRGASGPVQVAAATPNPAPAELAPVQATPSPAAFTPVAASSAPAAFDLARVDGSSSGVAAAPPAETAPVATPAASPPPPPPPRPNVSVAFADFDLAVAPVAPAPGAVDITKIKAPREKVVKEEAKPAKPAPPKEPARHWVQVATGKDRGRLSTDWTRISRNSKGLLKDSKPFIARWGETNRLLTGPFKTPAEARAFVTKLKEAGLDSFTFSSAEGEEVTPVTTK